MFPNSPNIRFSLLRIDTQQDDIGNQSYHLISSKEVIGMLFSVTSKEYYESLKKDIHIDLACRIQSFLYDGSRHAHMDGTIYRIERTFVVGQFLELYLIETQLKESDIDGYSR